MNLDALGNIGDFLGGIGVVVTLVYLAFQIRHNTRGLSQNNELMTLSFENEFRHDLLEFRMAIATDEKLSEIWRRGLAGVDKLEPAEDVRFELVVNNVLAMMNAQFEAHTRGQYRLTQAPYLRQVVSNPGFRERFERILARADQREADLGLGRANPEFVAYMESLLKTKEEA